MSGTHQRTLAAALTLVAVMASAAPAAAQRGIWVKINTASAWTLTVNNLTDYPLSLVTNAVEASNAQRPPFWGNTLGDEDAFPLPPYRNVTWKSNTATVAYPNSRWNGTLTVLPQGMDAKWTVTLNFQEHWFWTGTTDARVQVAGTWVWMTADLGGNPDWQDAAPYDISCSYPDSYNGTYNVLALSGTDLVVVFYAPYINVNGAPTVNATLVFKQRSPHTPLTNGYQDSLIAPCLKFQDNNGAW